MNKKIEQVGIGHSDSIFLNYELGNICNYANRKEDTKKYYKEAMAGIVEGLETDLSHRCLDMVYHLIFN